MSNGPHATKKYRAYGPPSRPEVGGWQFWNDNGPSLKKLANKLEEVPEPPNCHHDADYTDSGIESEHVGTSGR